MIGTEIINWVETIFHVTFYDGGLKVDEAIERSGYKAIVLSKKMHKEKGWTSKTVSQKRYNARTMKNQRLTYKGRVENGEIKLPKKMRPDMIRAFEGKDIEVIIRKQLKRRSNSQNAYLWGVAYQMVSDWLNQNDEFGAWTPTDVHDILKFKFLREEKINTETGEIVFEYTKSTTDLTTTEMMDYVTMIQKWASEFFGLYIPDPNEYVPLRR